MDILLDTNLLVLYSRNIQMAQRLEEDYGLFSKNNRLALSVVSKGELDALSKKLSLGNKRKQKLNELLQDITIIGINFRKVIEKYGDIDAYSQGKLLHPKGLFSARNMGKNDLWIAATASAFNLTLFTTDKDFQHLDNTFLNLQYIDLQKYTN